MMGDRTWPMAGGKWPICMLVLACGVAAGCSRKIETTYGKRRAAPKSISGTAVLAEMFEAAGHEVHSWHLLSPGVRDRANSIVWFPDDFQPPRQDVRRWLEDWLVDRAGRTLIYVGRDFDAAGWYWERIKPDAPPEQAERIEEKAAAAKNDFDILRRALPIKDRCGWFAIDGRDRPHTVRTLTGGDPQWLQGVDPSKLEIQLRSRILPPPTAEVLLESEGDVLVSRQTWGVLEREESPWYHPEWGEAPPVEQRWGESQLIVVANGSFLLNLPLVHHEHRKLAGKLINEVGPPGQFVVFLESGEGGPPIRQKEPSPEIPTGAEILLLWPSGLILWHFVVVGILFCFSRWPIFGPPRQLRHEGTSDFGKHVEALAELLQRSGDRAFARSRLSHYRQTAKGGE